MTTNNLKKISPELKTEIFLANWLYEQQNIEVWYNRKIKNLSHKNVFKTRGKIQKPDMLLFSHKLKQYIALEIKADKHNKNIYDSNKIIKYQQQHHNKETEYIINNRPVKISFFLSATKNSVLGRLFQDETIEMPGGTGTDNKWHEILQKTKQEPPKEYNKTKQFVRTLWSQWRIVRKKNEPGIGALLSTILDEDKDIKPKMFAQTYEPAKKHPKGRWKVIWREI